MRNLSIAVIAAGSMLAFTVLASAADVGAPGNKVSSPPVVAPAFSWTGCHLGIQGGGAVGRSRPVAAAGAGAYDGLPITGTLNTGGGLVGGTAGCDYQVNVLVFGVEDDLSWTNQKGSGPDIPPFAVAATNQMSAQWLDTLRGRAGVALDRVFVYGTGGVAWARTSVNSAIRACQSASPTHRPEPAGLWD
jgi:outer membrane immunogenic protein